MKHVKHCLFILLALMLACTLFGCGNGKESTSNVLEEGATQTVHYDKIEGKEEYRVRGWGIGAMNAYEIVISSTCNGLPLSRSAQRHSRAEPSLRFSSCPIAFKRSLLTPLMAAAHCARSVFPLRSVRSTPRRLPIAACTTLILTSPTLGLSVQRDLTRSSLASPIRRLRISKKDIQATPGAGIEQRKRRAMLAFFIGIRCCSQPLHQRLPCAVPPSLPCVARRGSRWQRQAL